MVYHRGMKIDLTSETFTLENLRLLTSKQLSTARVYTQCDVMKADHKLYHQMWIRSTEDEARRRFAMVQHVGHEKFGWAKPFGKFAESF
jgi:hypothetical protein